MTPERLAGIDARREAATPGDWEVIDANEGTEYGPMWMVTNDAFHNPPDDDDAPWLALELHTGIKADAEFIAHAPQDITDLRAEVDRLRAQVKAVRQLATVAQQERVPVPADLILDRMTRD